jgi:hypothetical protein
MSEQTDRPRAEYWREFWLDFVCILLPYAFGMLMAWAVVTLGNR